MNPSAITISDVEIFEGMPPYGDRGWKSVKQMSVKTDRKATFQEIGKALDTYLGPKIAPFRYHGAISGTGVDTSFWPHQFLAESGKTLFLYDREGRALLLGKD